MWEDHRPRSGVWKGTSGGEVISFSGCDDDQTSADTSVSLSNLIKFWLAKKQGNECRAEYFLYELYIYPLIAPTGFIKDHINRCHDLLLHSSN